MKLNKIFTSLLAFALVFGVMGTFTGQTVLAVSEGASETIELTPEENVKEMKAWVKELKTWFDEELKADPNNADIKAILDKTAKADLLLSAITNVNDDAALEPIYVLLEDIDKLIEKVFPPMTAAELKKASEEWLGGIISFLKEVKSETGVADLLKKAEDLKKELPETVSDETIDAYFKKIEALEAEVDKLFPPMTVKEEKAALAEWINDLKKFLSEDHKVKTDSFKADLESAEKLLKALGEKPTYEDFDKIYVLLDKIEAAIAKAFPEMTIEDGKAEVNKWIGHLEKFFVEAEKAKEDVKAFKATLEKIKTDLKAVKTWDSLDKIYADLDKLEEAIEKKYPTTK